MNPIPSAMSRLPRAILSPAIARPSLRVAARFAAAPRFQLQHHPRQNFHSTPVPRKGIFPDSEDPPAPNPQSNQPNNIAGAAAHVTEPTPLTDGQYHDYAEHYLNVVQTEIENLQEQGSDMEAEYSVRFPPPSYLVTSLQTRKRHRRK